MERAGRQEVVMVSSDAAATPFQGRRQIGVGGTHSQNFDIFWNFENRRFLDLFRVLKLSKKSGEKIMDASLFFIDPPHIFKLKFWKSFDTFKNIFKN